MTQPSGLRPLLALSLALVLSGMLAGCTSTTSAVRVATLSALRLPDASPDPALVEMHCPSGQPQILPSLEHGPTRVVTRAAYALEYDSLSKLPLWVCASLDPAVVFGDAERKNNWRPDPDLAGLPRAVDSDYKHSGFNRGHMTASEDRVATQELNDETFFLSNAVPQNGPLNSGQWQQLETAIRRWIESGILTEAKMITGGFFYDPAEDDPESADGLVPFEQIGDGVAVPTHVFKIVVGRHGGAPVAIAFVAENAKPAAGWSFRDGIKSVDWLEERAGLNFMPELDPGDEVGLESAPGAIPTP